jgi:hypothetical protein
MMSPDSEQSWRRWKEDTWSYMVGSRFFMEISFPAGTSWIRDVVCNGERDVVFRWDLRDYIRRRWSEHLKRLSMHEVLEYVEGGLIRDEGEIPPPGE